MLVLTFHLGERLMIGNDITVKVVEVYPGGRVKLGVTAPPDVAVDRECVRKSKDADKLRSLWQGERS